MHKNYGFSLMEVLVSLALVASVSLAVLKQQCQITQVFNHAQARLISESLHEFEFERMLVHVYTR